MKLIITGPNQTARELQVATSASIGRSADNTIHLDDASVARYHAMIEKRPNGFWLNDLGSPNGTLVNGAKLAAEHHLQNGDTIALGQNLAIRVVAMDGQAGASVAQQAANTTGTRAATSAPPSQGTEEGVPMMYVAVAGFTVFIIIGVVAAALYLPKLRGGSGSAKNQSPSGFTPPPSIPRPASPGMSSHTTSESTKPVTLPANTATSIEILVSKLAAQLSGKGNYVFHPDMISAIAARTKDYRVDVTAQAREYRLDVSRAFSDAKNLKPLYGHVLAVSQSRYGQSRGNGVGVWQLPPAIAQEYVQAGEDLAALNAPKRSAEVAAAHLQEIMTIFTAEDFMYALACFGQTRSTAGKLNEQLQAVDANDRRNFWKQVQSGLVSRDGAEKVIRFFAAGIVAENPAKFELPSATPLSEL